MPILHVILLSLLTVSFLFKVAFALSIEVPAHKNECFYEELGLGDKLTVTYQVGEGGNYEIDFWVSNPQDSVIASSSHEDKGTFTVTADQAGRYTYCFSNKMSSVAVKSISFNAHINEKNQVDANNQGDPLKKEIEELADNIMAVKAEQEYIVFRERRHRDTAESTNTRVKWWSVAQIVLLFVVCFWQVRYLKHFFEVKRCG